MWSFTGCFISWTCSRTKFSGFAPHSCVGFLFCCSVTSRRLLLSAVLSVKHQQHCHIHHGHTRTALSHTAWSHGQTVTHNLVTHDNVTYIQLCQFNIVEHRIATYNIATRTHTITHTHTLDLDSQKCQISQKIWCLSQTQLKNSTQTNFQGGSPWATLILNSMFVVEVLYCVQFFFWNVFFSTKKISVPLL